MIRWGVLGTGFISNTMVDAIKLSDGSEVAAVAGRNDKRVAEFASRHGIAEAERPSPQLSDSLEIMEMLTQWEQLCRASLD